MYLLSRMSAMSTAYSLQFYEFGGGSVFQVAATANDVTYNPATPIATPLATGTTAATSTSNGATLRFSFRDLIIPIVLSIGLLGGSLAALW
jgi:hypothetical protein